MTSNILFIHSTRHTVTGPAYPMFAAMMCTTSECVSSMILHTMNETRMLTVSILDEMIPRQYYSAEVECATTVHLPYVLFYHDMYRHAM